MPRRTARSTLLGLHAPGSSRGLSAGNADYNTGRQRSLSTWLQATNTAGKMTGTTYIALTYKTNSFRIKKTCYHSINATSLITKWTQSADMTRHTHTNTCVPYLSTLQVCSRQCAIQIHVYLYFTLQLMSIHHAQ